MKLVNKIKQVKKIGIRDNSLFVLLSSDELLKFGSGYQTSDLLKRNVYKFMLFGDYLFCQKEGDSDIFVLNFAGEEVGRFCGKYNLSHQSPDGVEYLLVTKMDNNCQQLILIDKNLTPTLLDEQVHGYTVSDKWIYTFKNKLCCHNIYNGHKLWERFIEEYNIDFEAKATTIRVVKNYVLVESFDKKLLCISVSNGGFIWLNQSIASGWGRYDDKIYGTLGAYIIEVDLHTGEELRRLNFSDWKEHPSYRAMNRLRVYDDVIICTDFSFERGEQRGVVAVLDRKTFKLLDFAFTQEMVSGRKYSVHRDGKTLCLLDLSKTLYLYQFDEGAEKEV